MFIQEVAYVYNTEYFFYMAVDLKNNEANKLTLAVNCRASHD